MKTHQEKLSLFFWTWAMLFFTWVNTYNTLRCVQNHEPELACFYFVCTVLAFLFATEYYQDVKTERLRKIMLEPSRR